MPWGYILSRSRCVRRRDLPNIIQKRRFYFLVHKKIEIPLRYTHLSQNHKAHDVEALDQKINCILVPAEEKLALKKSSK